MRDAARALDDVSDHLGEVLRHADELLVEWSRFGAQVRTAVDAEVAGIGEVVDGAVLRAANSGVDRAIVDRLRALSSEIERLEQRTRSASRAASEQRAVDRRLLWGVIAGIVLSNALLVVLLLRRPEVAPLPVAEPVRAEVAPAPSASVPSAEPDPTPAVVAEPGGGSAVANAGSAAPSVEPAAPDPKPGAAAGSAGKPPAAAKPGAGSAAKPGPEPAGSAVKSTGAGVALPRPIGAHTHRNW